MDIAGHRTPLMLFFCALLCLFRTQGVHAASPQSSFLGYVPSPRDFQAPLHPAVQLAAEAAALDGAKQKSAAQDKYSEAVKTSEKLLQTLSRGYHDELYQLIGYCYDRSGQYTQAVAAYDKSLALKANNPVVVFRRALMLREQKRCSEAIPGLREVLWRTKDNAHEVMFLIAECVLETGQDAEALKLSQEAYQNNPLFLPVLRQLTALRERSLAKETDPAVQAVIEQQITADLTAVVRQDPQDRESSLKLARLLLKQGDPLLNAEALRRAQALGEYFAEQSQYKDVESVKLVFDAQVRRGALDEAEQTLDRALQISPDSQVLHQAQKQLTIQRGALVPQ